MKFRSKHYFRQLKHLPHFLLGSKFSPFAIGTESKNELFAKTKSLETSSCATSELHKATPNICVLWRGHPPSHTLVTHMTKAWDKNSYLIQKSGNAIPCDTLSPNPHSSSSLSHCQTSPAPPRALLDTSQSPCYATSHTISSCQCSPSQCHHQMLKGTLQPLPAWLWGNQGILETIGIQQEEGKHYSQATSPGVTVPKTWVSRSS